MPLTDLENARRFAGEHRDSLRHLARSRRWLVWDGMRWRADETAEVQRRAKETVRRLHAEAKKERDPDKRARRVGLAVQAQSAHRIAGMVELAKSEPGIPVTEDQLDTDPWLLNVKNGTLDLRTGTLRPHRQEDLITKLAPVAYSPTAPCPTWEQFLHRIMDGDAERIRYVQKALGYALTGDTSEQCFFILHGVGANGKTTMTTAVAKAVGGYAQHTPTSSLMAKRNETIPNDVARLHGARLVTAAEAEWNQALAEALIKQLTGGDKMTARFLHREFFEFVPSFKLFLAVNHKPVIKGTDHAIWRRVRLIPFDVTIPEDERDKTLPDKLEAERAGILRWMVEGCLAWQRDGLEAPDAVAAASAAYRDEMDTVGDFIDECCVRDSDVDTPAHALYAAYRHWCEKHEENAMGPAEFGTRLTEKGFEKRRTKAARGWRGLGLLVTG